jgi:hypothetical protein
MDKKTISEGLRSLIEDTTRAKRSNTARLREVIDDVENALAAGVRRIDIVNELAKHGLVMPLSSFDSALKRIRESRDLKLSSQAKQKILRTDKKEEDQNIFERDNTDQILKQEKTYDPREIDKIFANKPDLDALERFAKRKKP